MRDLQREASSSTAGREERNVESFWREKTSYFCQWVEREKSVERRR